MGKYFWKVFTFSGKKKKNKWCSLSQLSVRVLSPTNGSSYCSRNGHLHLKLRATQQLPRLQEVSGFSLPFQEARLLFMNYFEDTLFLGCFFSPHGLQLMTYMKELSPPLPVEKCVFKERFCSLLWPLYADLPQRDVQAECPSWQI